MDAPRFYRLALRTPAYQGVMQARLAAQQQGQHSSQAHTPARGTPGRVQSEPSRTVAPTRTAIGADPVLSGLISFGSG